MRRATAVAIATCLLACRAGSHPPGDADFEVAVPYGCRSLDPHRDVTLSAHMATLFNVYEGLVQLDRELGIQPGLARSWSTPDERTWVFELREARFHSGRPLTAEDVVYSYERARRAPSDAGYYLGNVESVAAQDPRTVVVRTRQSSPLLMTRLSFVLVVPRGSTDDGLKLRADGTGPYRVAAFEPDAHLRLERSPAWWGPAPALAAARVRFGASEAGTAEALLDGRVHLALLRTREAIARLRGAAHLRARESEALYVSHLAWRIGAPAAGQSPFSDLRVRRAVQLAIDREGLAGALPAHARAAGQAVTRDVFGFDPALVPPARDLARARDLLREAGLPPGTAVDLEVRPRFRAPAVLVAEQLAAIGLRIRVRDQPDETLFARLARGEPVLWLDAWGCTTGDAGELLENAVHSRGGIFGALNETGYANPALDRVIEEAARSVRNDRREGLQRALRIMADDLVWLPLYTEVDTWVVDARYEWEPRPDISIRLTEARPRAAR